jgi:uncharacterized protein (DUF4415 family)
MAMSEKSTRRRSLNQKAKTDWRRFDAQTDAQIAEAVEADPDSAPLLSPAWIEKAKLVAPQEKQLISIRLDKDVLEYFRARPRYQSRINAILRTVMEHEKGERG